MPRRKASAAPVSTELPNAAPAKRRGRAKTELTEVAKIEKSEPEKKVRKVSKAAKALNAESAPSILDPAPKKKRGAPFGNQNAKGNKSVPGNKHAVGNKGRAPLFPITEDQFDQIRKLSSIAATQREAASFLGFDEDYFEGVLRTNARARKAWDIGGPAFNVSLRRKNVEVAMSGNVQMLKFLSINRLGMVDKVEHSGDPERPIKAEMTFKVEFVKNAIGADQYSTAGGF